jgi:hypothetical protein
MFSNQNDELTKQIIEMSKKNEYEKIEKLLEDELKHDPENIGILFRLALLNFHSPIDDYPSCCLLLEKVNLISKKHAAIAKLLISCIKDCEFGFIYKRALTWFYEGKDHNFINNFIKELIDPIIESSIYKDVSTRTRLFFENRVKYEPRNIEALLLLSIIEINTSKSFINTNIKLLEKIVMISEENEAVAVIILAYIKDFNYIDDDLLNRLNNLQTKNAEINSMIKFMISLAYKERDNIEFQEKYLKESIDIYQGHAWNYMHLEDIYQRQGKKTEAEKLKQMAQSNIKIKDYSELDFKNYDPTDVNDFLNERIKGITSIHVSMA